MDEPTDPVCEEDLLHPLATMIDPELGMNIVELGMVRMAAWRNGDIEVALTPTSPSCPLTHMLIHDAEDALRQRFPDAGAIRIELVWDPPWTVDRLKESARRQLGLSPGE